MRAVFRVLRRVRGFEGLNQSCIHGVMKNWHRNCRFGHLCQEKVQCNDRAISSPLYVKVLDQVHIFSD